MAYEAYLYVNISVVGGAFNENLQFKKRVTDDATGIVSYAATWRDSGTGTHGSGGSGGDFILQKVSEATDRFIDEFLRVNADSC